jgi:hypothetical protein
MQNSRKLGRPRLDAETEQVAVRLPKPWVDAMRPHLSQNIRDRLYRSLFEEHLDRERDPHMVKISGQIEELARSVRRATGADWHADRISQQIFLETLRLLFASLPVPTAELSSVKLDPQAAAQIIFNSYAETVREHEQREKTIVMKPTLRSQLEK